MEKRGGKLFHLILILFLTAGFFILPKIVSADEKQLIITEVLPNPSGEETKNEYIEFFNFSSKEEDISDWVIKDSSASGSYKFPSGTKIKSKDYFVVYRSDFSFALNNSGEKVFLLNPDGKEIDSVSYGTAKEDISYNFDGINWRWSKYLTPEKENKFDVLPAVEIKKDKNFYKNTYANFEAIINNSKNSEVKVTWDFGDGHKSYLQKTKHKYLETGTYLASLKVKGESEDYVEDFIVEVEKFGGAKIKIIAVNANPKGKDAKKETITLKNNSKKKIDLKGWSIATGWENLYNHPINKKFVLKPGEAKKITKKYSAFTLNNKKTKIELRYPDGTVAEKIKYSKKEGIQDDEIYENLDGNWEWTNAQTNTEETRTSTEEIDKTKEGISNSEEINNENQPENDLRNQVQDDEIVEDLDEDFQGDVLGAEIVRRSEIKDNNGFLSNIFWSANQIINNLINFFV